MSSVRQKAQAIHKAMLKKEEEILNGNQPIINEDANNETEVKETKKETVKKTSTKTKTKKVTKSAPKKRGRPKGSKNK
tara:strand:+ start:1124 stop:1357 length:234 start_codon:yes stop_codon:yes gene_type:complete